MWAQVILDVALLVAFSGAVADVIKFGGRSEYHIALTVAFATSISVGLVSRWYFDRRKIPIYERRFLLFLLMCFSFCTLSYLLMDQYVLTQSSHWVAPLWLSFVELVPLSGLVGWSMAFIPIFPKALPETQ